MTTPTVSVIVASRDRPGALRRCLMALDQVQYPNFEIVAVSDEAGVVMLQTLAMVSQVKRARFEEANISAARNVGLSLAAGEIVAFIDDDAVPEPSWLSALVSPFAEDIDATGGYVRGRNGISWQWTGRAVNAAGETRPLKPDERVPEGWAVKTEGTNMAFRADVLRGLGGFDAAFRFFLDETDVNLRLAEAGHKTALVPGAEVHHGFAASSRRRQDRVPRDLFEIGASWAVFLRKHLKDAGHIEARIGAVRHSEWVRLDGHLIAGRLEPRDVRRLKQSFDAGVSDGRQRAIAQHMPDVAAPPAFLRYPAVQRRSSLITCRPLTAARTRSDAAQRVKNGEIVTVLNLSPTGLFHVMSFAEAGFWEQSGGLFGRSQRDQPLFRLWRRQDRVAAEKNRLRHQRLLPGK